MWGPMGVGGGVGWLWGYGGYRGAVGPFGVMGALGGGGAVGRWDPFDPPLFTPPPPSLQTSCRRSRITSHGSRAQLRGTGGGGFWGEFFWFWGRFGVSPCGAFLGSFCRFWGHSGSF